MQQLNDAKQELRIQEENLRAAEQERQNVLAANSKKLKAADEAYIGATVEAANARERSKIAEEQLVAEQEANAANWQALDTRTQELESATKELANAQWQYAQRLKDARDAQAAVGVIQNGGVWNPNGAPIGGRANPRRGAAANNVDNQGFNDFAKPEGWD